MRDRLTRYIYVSKDPDDPTGLLEVTLKKAVAAEEAEKKLERAIRAGTLRRYHGIDWIGEAMAQGIVTESEGQQLRELEALTARVIAVDHFDPAALKPNYKTSAGPVGTIRAASKAPRPSRTDRMVARRLPRRRRLRREELRCSRRCRVRCPTSRTGASPSISGASPGPSSIARARARIRSAAARSRSWREIVAEVEEGARDKSDPRPRHHLRQGDAASSSAPTSASSPISRPKSDVIEKLRPVTALFDRIERLPVPVVCAINGFCLGGGLELALACHYRIATRDDGTKLGFPEVKLGIFPGFNGTARSIRQAGAPAAMQAMLTGKMLSASAARAHGPRRQLVDSRGALPWAARKAVLRNRKSKPAGFAASGCCPCGRRATCSPSACAHEVSKKAREDHYPAPFRLIDLFERYGGNDEAMKAAETRAFAPLMVSDSRAICAACSGCRSC